ncbi:22254_t:CDS:1, partial [Gigaspora rosea]
MLNKTSQSLEKWFIGFYLESIIIEVSPINNNTNNGANSSFVSFILKDPYSPQQIEPKSYEVSTGHMTSNNVQCSLSSQNIGASISRSSTNNVSTKETIGEWEMKVESCPIKGVIWPYHYKKIKFDKIDPRIFPDLR